MLTIRLVRTGKKNAPSYRVVLIKKTAPPKSGKFLEILGSYNPRLKQISLKKDRIEHWLNKGIQTSDTVHNLLVSQGIVKGDKIKKKFKIKKKQEAKQENKDTVAKEPAANKEESPKQEKEPVKEEAPAEKPNPPADKEKPAPLPANDKKTIDKKEKKE